MKHALIALCALVVGLVGGYYFGYDIGHEKATKFAADNAVDSYEECLLYTKDQAMIAIYPPQCQVGSKTFTQDIGNELELAEKIIIETPRPGTVVASPLTIKGTARGSWFFEANFPVELYDDSGTRIAVGVAKTSEDWMTEDFVAYEAVLTFTAPAAAKGYLLLKKDNPSGLPENDNSLRVPVIFQ